MRLCSLLVLLAPTVAAQRATPTPAVESPWFLASVTLVVPAGDVTGDDFDDVLITRDQTLELYRGSPGGLLADPIVIQPGPNTPSRMVAIGDWNGDGHDDLLSWGLFTVVPHEGSPDGLVTGATRVMRVEHCIAAGDVDSDGYDDALVFSSLTAGGENILLRGGPEGLSEQPDWLVLVPGGTRPLGPGGDFNGDGFDDLVVSTRSRRLGVFFGGPDGPSTALDQSSTDLTPDRLRVARSVGDLNGDGYDDLAYSDDGNLSGVIFGSAQGLDFDSTTRLGTRRHAVHGSGDFNGDGWPQILTTALTVEADLEDARQSAHLFGGRGTTDLLTSVSVDPGGRHNGALALIGQRDWYLAAGDVNGDGRDDVLSLTRRGPFAELADLALHLGPFQSRWLGGTGKWSDPTRWSAGVPDATLGARIETGQVLLDVDAAARDLHISPGAALRSSQDHLLRLYGGLQASGELDLAGELRVSGHAALRITGSARVGVLNLLPVSERMPSRPTVYGRLETGHLIHGAESLGLAGLFVTGSQQQNGGKKNESRVHGSSSPITSS